MRFKNSLKYALSLLVCVFIRLLPMPPNIEPVMFTTMPLAKEFGKFAGFVYASFAIILLDVLVGRAGYWTAYTAIPYGIIGYASAVWFSKQKLTRGRDYAIFAFFATILYDAVTAFMFGLQFGQSLDVTIAGQIPFTIQHLAGNLVLGYFLSPLVHKWIVTNPRLESFTVLGRA